MRAKSKPELKESVEVKLQRCFQALQQRISVCMCGELTGKPARKMADKADKAAAVAAALETAIAEKTAIAASDKRKSDVDGSQDEAKTAVDAVGDGEDVTAVDSGCVGLGVGLDGADGARVDCGGADGADGGCADGIGAGRGDWVPYLGENGEDVSNGNAGAEVPLEGGRLYELEDAYMVAPDSEEEAEDGRAGIINHAPCCHPFAEANPRPTPPGPRDFLVLRAVGDDAIAAILPSADVIDAMLGTVEHAPSSPAAARLRGMINEDLILVQLFLQRMRTPAFLSWVGRDGSCSATLVKRQSS